MVKTMAASASLRLCDERPFFLLLTSSFLLPLSVASSLQYEKDAGPYERSDEHGRDAVQCDGLPERLQDDEDHEHEEVQRYDRCRERHAPHTLHPQADASGRGHEPEHDVVPDEPGQDRVGLGREAQEHASPFHDGEETENDCHESSKTIFVHGNLMHDAGYTMLPDSRFKIQDSR